MFCGKCGNQLQETGKFCEHCGAAIIEQTPVGSKNPSKRWVAMLIITILIIGSVIATWVAISMSGTWGKEEYYQLASVVEYDAAGNVTERWDYGRFNDEGLIVEYDGCTYEYDEGKVIRINMDESDYSCYEYYYDENDNLNMSKHFIGGYNPDTYTLYSYNDENQLIRKGRYECDMEVWYRQYEYSGGKVVSETTCDLGEVVAEKKYSYDQGGNLIKSISEYTNSNGKGKTTQTFEYNEKGQRIRYVEVTERGTGYSSYTDNECYQYIYDNKGRLVEKREYSDGELRWQWICSYDEEGNIEKIKLYLWGKLQSIYKFKYKKFLLDEEEIENIKRFNYYGQEGIVYYNFNTLDIREWIGLEVPCSG